MSSEKTPQSPENGNREDLPDPDTLMSDIEEKRERIEPELRKSAEGYGIDYDELSPDVREILKKAKYEGLFEKYDKLFEKYRDQPEDLPKDPSLEEEIEEVEKEIEKVVKGILENMETLNDFHVAFHVPGGRRYVEEFLQENETSLGKEQEKSESQQEAKESSEPRSEKISSGNRVYWQLPSGERSSELTVEEITEDKEGNKLVSVEGESRLYPLEEIKLAESSEEELRDDPEAQEVAGEIEEMSDEERERVGWGLHNLGYKVEEMKGRVFRNVYGKIGEKLNKQDSQSTAARWFTSLAEQFDDKARQAHEAMIEYEERRNAENRTTWEKIKEQAKDKWQLTSNALKGAGMFISPRRWLMAGGLALSSGAEAGKEARLKNLELIEETRFEDAEAAAEEAWSIYEEAEKKAGGDSEVTKAILKQAYLESIPGNILKRLEGVDETFYDIEKAQKEAQELQEKAQSISDEEGISTEDLQTAFEGHFEDLRPGQNTSFAGKLFEKQIRRLASRLNQEFFEIDMNDELTEKQKEAKKKEILGKWNRSQALQDYDRMITDQGKVDLWAMSARNTEKVGKGVVAVAMADAVYKMLDMLPDAVSGVDGVFEADAPEALEETGEISGAEEMDTAASQTTESTEPVVDELSDQEPVAQTIEPDMEPVDQSAIGGMPSLEGLEDPGEVVDKITQDDSITNSVEQLSDHLSGETITVDGHTFDIDSNTIQEALDHTRSTVTLSDGTEVPLDELHLVHEGDELVLHSTDSGELYLEFNAESGEAPGDLQDLYEAQMQEDGASDWVKEQMQQRQDQNLSGAEATNSSAETVETGNLTEELPAEEEVPVPEPPELSDTVAETGEAATEVSLDIASPESVDQAASVLSGHFNDADKILHETINSYLETGGKPSYIEELDLPKGMSLGELRDHIYALDDHKQLTQSLHTLEETQPQRFQALRALYNARFEHLSNPEIPESFVGEESKELLHSSLSQYLSSDASVDLAGGGGETAPEIEVNTESEAAPAETTEDLPADEKVELSSEDKQILHESGIDLDEETGEAASDSTSATTEAETSQSGEEVETTTGEEALGSETTGSVPEHPTRQQIISLISDNTELNSYPQNLAGNLSVSDAPGLGVSENDLNSLIDYMSSNNNRGLTTVISEMKGDNPSHLATLSELFEYHMEHPGEVRLGIDISEDHIKMLDNYVDDQFQAAMESVQDGEEGGGVLESVEEGVETAEDAKDQLEDIGDILE